MVDKNTIFGGMLTTLGANKKTNCDALGIPWEPKYMLIGDANGTDPVPSPSQTRLINQVYRAQLNQLRVSEKDANVLIAELVLPPDVGGWWIRELALEDKDGVFCAVSNVAPSYKPLLEQNSGRNQVVRMHIITNGTSNIQLKIDPSVVLATREYVDSRILEELSKLDIKQSVRAATTANINLVGLQVVDGVSLSAGDRVLVKNQAAAKDNGPYEAAVGAWTRAKDADSNVRVTANLTVAVEAGATQADTIWQLVTDGPIIVGTTALTFKDITDGLARLLSPSFAGNPTAPTPARFDNSKSLATTEFAKLRGVEFSGFTSNSASLALSSVHVGGLHSFSDAAQLTATMPPTSGIAQGATITLACAGPGGLKVIGAGADVVYTSTGVSGPMILALGDTAEFIRLEGQWRLVGGTVVLRYAGVASGPYFTTQPQFDSSKSLATAEFVQREKGSFANSVPIAGGNVTLTAAHVGARIEMSANGTLTLPKASTLPKGSSILITTSSAVEAAKLALSAGDALAINNVSVASPYTMAMGSDILLVSDGEKWRAHASLECLRTSSLFACSLEVTGWRRLPSGEVEQWGLSGGSKPNVSTPITFPLAFPTACVNVQLTYVDAGTHYPASRGAPVQVGTCSKTGFTYSHSGTNTSGGAQHFWTARGY